MGVVNLIPPAWQYPEITCSQITLGDKAFKTRDFRESIWKQSSKIKVSGEHAGMLEVCYSEEKPEREEGPFLAEERLLINAIAGRLGRIIELHRGHDELMKAHDVLEKRVEERTKELMITNLKLNQEIEERTRAEHALKESSEKIKLFAYSISHDLKSPAVGIYGLAKRLNNTFSDVLDEKGRNYCGQILKASEQIGTLAEQINAFISTKETPLKIDLINMKEILPIIRDEVSSQINIRQINWLESDNMSDMRADKLSLLRMLRNLVDNALKYGGDNLSEIRIGFEETEAFHILSVSDNGVGIKEENSNKIFELFQRDKTSSGIEGSGLGLAIVKEIAEKHDGKVWVESDPETGTTFYVSISKLL
jgi:signal transduction histidine kinase